MKYLTYLLLFYSLAVSADDGQSEKPFNIGIGGYGADVFYENAASSSDDGFTGGVLSLAYNMSDQFGFRANYYSLQHDTNSSFDNEGYDLLAYLGTGLSTNGLKAYVGGGLYRETWQQNTTDKTFSGLQVTGGVGYNWDYIALDFILNLRDPRDYEDNKNQSSPVDVTATAGSFSWLLSYRF